MAVTAMFMTVNRRNGDWLQKKLTLPGVRMIGWLF